MSRIVQMFLLIDLDNTGQHIHPRLAAPEGTAKEEIENVIPGMLARAIGEVACSNNRDPSSPYFKNYAAAADRMRSIVEIELDAHTAHTADLADAMDGGLKRISAEPVKTPTNLH